MSIPLPRTIQAVVVRGTEDYRLEGIAEALAAMKAGEVARSIVTF